MMEEPATAPPSKRARGTDDAALLDDGTLKTWVIRARRLVVDGSVLFEPGVVLVRAGRICAVAAAGPDEPAEVTSALAAGATVFDTDLLVPGFIDIHTHGIGGSNEIRDFWHHPEYTQARVVRYGTTSLLATMVIPAEAAKQVVSGRKQKSASPKFCGWCPGGDSCACEAASPKVAEDVLVIAKKLRSVVGKLGYGAVLAGIHAEGPVVESLGGLPIGDADMSVDSFGKLLDCFGSDLKIMTIAPSKESRAAQPFERLKLLIERGIRPAFGHDNGCTLSEIAAALKVAAAHKVVPHITHAFNVQRFHHRDCGLANVALLPKFPRLPIFEGAGDPPTIELIGDGVHAAIPTLQLAVASKPSGSACFITDGIAEPVLGKKLGYADREATVEQDADGRYGVYSVGADTGKKLLIGSCIMILDAFKTAVEILDVGLCRAVDLCCVTPARVANLPDVGAIHVGKRADLVLLDEKFGVTKVLVAGDIVYDSGENN